ncbi:type II toxin-antitoxin system PemK/MazF family toxin [Priestia aryabhattai]
MVLKRGQIIWANLNGEKDELQGENIPCVIVQNNRENSRSETIVVIPMDKAPSDLEASYSSHIHISSKDIPAMKLGDLKARCDQIRVIDKQRISKVENAFLSKDKLARLDKFLLTKLKYGSKTKTYQLVWVRYNDGVGEEKSMPNAFPALVVWKDNENKSTIVVAPLLKNKRRHLLSGQVLIPSGVITPNFNESVVSFNQIRVMDKSRVQYGSVVKNIELPDNLSLKIDQAFIDFLNIQLYQKGQIVWVDLDGVKSEQKGIKPCVVVQNDVGNGASPTTIVLPLTSSTSKVDLPVHVKLGKEDFVNSVYDFRDSIVLCEQVRAIDKKRIVGVDRCILQSDIMKRIEEALLISIGYGQGTRHELISYTAESGLGSEHRSDHPIPAVSIQNDYGNKHSTILIVAPIASKRRSKTLPTQVEIENFGDNPQTKIALLEQVRVIDESRLVEKYDKLSKEKSKEIDNAYCVSLGIMLK